jgi:hypothetical protein
MLAVTRRESEGHQAVLDGQQLDKKTQWSMEGIQELGSMDVGGLTYQTYQTFTFFFSMLPRKQPMVSGGLIRIFVFLF